LFLYPYCCLLVIICITFASFFVISCVHILYIICVKQIRLYDCVFPWSPFLCICAQLFLLPTFPEACRHFLFYSRLCICAGLIVFLVFLLLLLYSVASMFFVVFELFYGLFYFFFCIIVIEPCFNVLFLSYYFL